MEFKTLNELNLKNENDYLDVWVCGFGYFAELEEKEAEKFTVIDLLKCGYAKKFDLNVYSGNAGRFEKILIDNKFEALNYFIKTFSSILHRKELVLFLRESLDFINFEEFEKDKRWLNVRERIFASCASLTEEDKKLIISNGARGFLTNVCNYLTHRLDNRSLQGEEEVSQIRSAGLIHKASARVIIGEYDSATDIFVNYTPDKGLHRYKFLVGQKELRDLDNLIVEHLLGLPYANPNECTSYYGRGEKQIHINYGNITKTCFLDSHQVQAVAERQKRNLDYSHVFYENDDKHENDDFAKQVVGVVDTIDCSLSYFRQFLMCHSALAAYILCAFAFNTQKSELERWEVATSKSAVRKMLEKKDSNFISHLTIKYAKDTIMDTFWRKYPKHIYDTFSEAVGILTAHRALEPNRMYTELLLLELLEILEIMDSKQGKEKVYWQNFVDTYSIFDEISKQPAVASDSRGQIAIIHVLRNALVHIRYVVDNERIYFYDGKDKYDFKFELSLDELETLKECALEFINENAIGLNI